MKKPGSVTLGDHMTVTRALALAGGPDDFADVRVLEPCSGIGRIDGAIRPET